jgi:hypothetical protein
MELSIVEGNLAVAPDEAAALYRELLELAKDP